jgi:DNA-directed RNA polymerase specialized sigma24 family protein
MIRRRAPSWEVDDLLQATLADALAAPRCPAQPDEMRRWVFAIARNKVADYHRRGRREQLQELPDLEAPGTSQGVGDLLRWAEKVLPQGEKAQEALHWMLREGEGETLETMAEEARLPAPQVRKRVSRLRRHFRTRWALEVAALLVVTLIAVGIALVAPKRPTPAPEAEHVPAPPPSSIPVPAEDLRQRALQDCEKGRWQECVEALDEARRLDPAGDALPAVQAARGRARDALTPPPLAPPAPSSHRSRSVPPSVPTATAPVRPSSRPGTAIDSAK